MGALSLYLDLENRLIDYLVFVPLVALGPLGDQFIVAALQFARPRRTRNLVLWAGCFVVSAVGAVLFALPIPVRFLYAGGYAWLTVVYVSVLVELLRYFRPGWLEAKHLQLFFFLVLVNIVLVVAMGGVQLWGVVVWMFPLWIGTIFSVMGLVVLVWLRPDLFETLAQVVEEQRQKYAKSRWETGVDAAVCRLERHMEDQAPHLRADLKIAELATDLAMGPEQLSELINSRFACNFNQFVNQYRVNHACRALVSDPHLTVLDVCFRSGFNSKSAFNQAFKLVTGLTPREFRLKKKDDPTRTGSASKFR